MKLLSKFAFLLLLAGVLAIILSFANVGPRVARLHSRISAAAHHDPAALQAKQNSRPESAAAAVGQVLSEQVAQARVRLPAIRGENNYGWIQLPRGTSVEFVQQSAGDLIVRWDGLMVKVPQTAALTGAISLRQPSRLASRN